MGGHETIGDTGTVGTSKAEREKWCEWENARNLLTRAYFGKPEHLALNYLLAKASLAIELEPNDAPREAGAVSEAMVDITKPGDGPWRVVPTEDGPHVLKFDVMTGKHVSACGGVGYLATREQAVACCAALNAVDCRAAEPSEGEKA